MRGAANMRVVTAAAGRWLEKDYWPGHPKAESRNRPWTKVPDPPITSRSKLWCAASDRRVHPADRDAGSETTFCSKADFVLPQMLRTIFRRKPVGAAIATT